MTEQGVVTQDMISLFTLDSSEAFWNFDVLFIHVVVYQSDTRTYLSFEHPRRPFIPASILSEPPFRRAEAPKLSSSCSHSAKRCNKVTIGSSRNSAEIVTTSMGTRLESVFKGQDNDWARNYAES